MTASSLPFWRFAKGSWRYNGIARQTHRARTKPAPAPDSGLNSEMIPAGFEHPPKPSGKTDILDTGGANCGALPDTSAPTGPTGPTDPPPEPDPEMTPEADEDPGLSRIIEAWPTLPEGMRAGILAMVEASSGEGGAGP
jgi:hypothetical protein